MLSAWGLTPVELSGKSRDRGGGALQPTMTRLKEASQITIGTLATIGLLLKDQLRPLAFSEYIGKNETIR